MTNAGQPPTTEERLSRLEVIFADMAEVILNNVEVTNQHSEVLTRLEANSSRHDEALIRLEAISSRHDETLVLLERQTARTTNAIDRLIATTERLAVEAAQDRQTFQTEIRRIWEYLRDRNGGSSTPQ